jgi:hypothetical protein
MTLRSTAGLVVVTALALTAAAHAEAGTHKKILPRPMILSITASPGQTPAAGKPVVINIRTRHTTTCTFFGQRSVTSVLVVVKTVSCASGHARVTMPRVRNATHASKQIRYMVLARGAGHFSVERRVTVLEAGTPVAPPPPVATPPVAVVVPIFPLAVTGSAYSATIGASGGSAPYSWSVASGSLPAGLALSAGGVISGTPTSAGETAFTVQVSDSTPATAKTATAVVTLDVSAAGNIQMETSDNWSGYVEQGGPFTAAAGTFTVPGVAPSSARTDMSEWVGIDGAGNSSLIQAGVDEIYDPASGGATIFAWWEILPAAATPITLAVAPGNVVSVSIAQLSPGTWAISITNNTTGQGFSIQQSYSGPAASAEWIVEAPTLNDTVETLGTYSPMVTFSNLALNGLQAGLTSAVMVQNGVAVSTPSTFTPGGFNVAYGAGAPPPPS